MKLWNRIKRSCNLLNEAERKEEISAFDKKVEEAVNRKMSSLFNVCSKCDSVFAKPKLISFYSAIWSSSVFGVGIEKEEFVCPSCSKNKTKNKKKQRPKG